MAKIVSDNTIRQIDGVAPAALSNLSGSSIANRVDALIDTANRELGSSSSAERQLHLFQLGWSLMYEITEFNSFAGKARPTEEHLSTLVDQAWHVGELLEEIEAHAAPLFSAPEDALASFARHVMQEVKADPRHDIAYLEAIATAAKRDEFDYLHHIQQGIRVGVAENLTDDDIKERIAALAPQVSAWLHTELEFQIHLLAAMGVAEDMVKERLSEARLATSYDLAAVRAKKLQEIEQKDHRMDSELTAKLTPIMESLVHLLKDAAQADRFKKIPDIWQQRIGDWEQQIIRKRLETEQTKPDK